LYCFCCNPQVKIVLVLCCFFIMVK
jgi:hypothetical protein